MNERVILLEDAVAMLASDAAAQLDYLGTLGLPDGVDELALEFDALAAAANDMLRAGEINRKQYDTIKQLSDLLSQMSGKANSCLWTPAALSSAKEWTEVRELAKKCLRLLELSHLQSSTYRFQLVLQFPTYSMKDYDGMVALENAIMESLGDLGNVDGHDAGSVEMNIFILTNQPLPAFERVKQVLGEYDQMQNVKAAFREVGNNAFTILHPANLSHFAIV